jgi:hypothetical protein
MTKKKATEVTLGAADADRLASRFGRAPEALRAVVGMSVRDAANALALPETELTEALADNALAASQREAQAEAERADARAASNDHNNTDGVLDDGKDPNATLAADNERRGIKSTKKAAKRTAKKAPAKKAAKKTAKKASPRKTAAKRSAKKR